MRAVLIGTSDESPTTHLRSAADWEVLDDPGFGRDDVLARFAEVREHVRTSGRNRLPTHVDNSLIRRVIDAHPEYKARSIYPAAIANALLILSQIPAAARHDLEAEQIVVAVHHELNVHAVLFVRADGTAFTVRARHDDRSHLEPATDSMATSLAAAGTRYTRNAELLEVTGGLIAEGRVVTYRTRVGAWFRAALSPVPRTLLLVGLVLTVFDLAFFVISRGEHNAWTWLDGFSGRLATAAFGAALIAGAQQASKLRELLRLRGPARGQLAAYVNWQ
ncbi:MAG: hypothetical protein J7513_04315 [Solirubrobacteraceae bacterium]|nr:hypothetical protein [Solirubrobacteraceae bacterium]